jgi:hypothetical protein
LLSFWKYRIKKEELMQKEKIFGNVRHVAVVVKDMEEA